MENPLLDRTYLYDRHRLSHQQIDRLLGENRAKEFLKEKLIRLEAVKQFLTITDLLRDHAIGFVCLKGPMLSYRIYGDPSVRYSHDIDLLIDLNHLDQALNLMFENGFELQDGSFWPEKKIQQDLLVSSHHHLSFNHKLHQKLCVELHWTLMNNLPVSKEKLKELIDCNLTTMDFAGRSYTVMNQELELLFLMIHGSRHAWHRLKWLMDIKDYPLKNLDQSRFEDLSRELKADRIIGQTDFLLRKYLNSHLNIKFKGKIPDYFVSHAQHKIEDSKMVNMSAFSIIRTFIYQFYMFPDWNFKLEKIKGIFFRQGDVANYNFSSKLSYIVYRPYSFIKRRVFHG